MNRCYVKIGNTILCFSNVSKEMMGEKVHPGTLLFEFSVNSEEVAQMVMEDLKGPPEQHGQS